jgi:ADP-ribose pyrophosphatase YjhB (NUDIX family)
VGDTPGGVAVRETREESGYEVVARKLVAVFDKSRHEHPPSLYYTYKILVLCDLVGGEPRHSHETDGVGFFARDALPELDLERTTPGQLATAFAHKADPGRPADFD